MLIDEVFLLPADSYGRERMTERIVKSYPDTQIGRIATSITSRPINAFYIGDGKRYVTVFAAHHALESITSNIAYLLIYYLLAFQSKNSVFDFDCKLLLSKFRFIIVPCVNPDGVELRMHGAQKTPLYDRQMRMSGGDFTRWQANARGVDLNHNYDFRFIEYKKLEQERGIIPGPSLFSGESPESEPEARGVANLIRTLNPCAVVSLHSQGEQIYSFPDTRDVRRIAITLAEMTGYKLSVPSDTAGYTGLCDYTSSLGIPSFTFEVGKGTNPLSEKSVPDIFFRIWRSVVLIPTML